MSEPVSLIVTDTSPLFILVFADALDALLLPGLAVTIPDAVYIEATRVHAAAGAERIMEWINATLTLVRIVPTDIGIDQQRAVPSEDWANSRLKPLSDSCAGIRLPKLCCSSRIATSGSARDCR
jgi:hypothetical protein